MTTSAPPAMLGAASPLTREVLDGPPRKAVVLARFPSAVYLGLGPHHQVLPVVACDGLMLPTAARLPVPARGIRWGVQAGDAVTVGRSTIALPGWTIGIVRQWRPARVATGTPASTDRLEELGDALVRDLVGDADPSTPLGTPLGVPLATGLGIAQGPGAWSLPDRAGAVLRSGLAGDSAALRRRVGRLLGAGAGLTPSGDDALCAVLLVLHGIGARAAADLVGGCIAEACTATTSLSASLLDAARQGYAIPAVARLVRLALDGDRAAVAAAAPAVLAIGHSSGRDLLAGLAGCLRVLAAPIPATRPLRAATQPAGRGNP